MKRKKFSILLMLLVLSTALSAQPYYGWRLGAGVGGTSYWGDLSYRLNAAKISWPAYQLLLGRSLSPSFDAELNGSWGRFSASDRATDWRGDLRTDNPNFGRGLNFESHFRTANLLLQYKFNNGYLLSRYARLAPYLYAGGGITDFTVYGDPQSNGTFDAELSARESGADYPTRVLTVPFGAGADWRISDRFSADLRAGAHYATTDYLDNLQAGRGNDVYFTGSVSLRYHFDLGSKPFRGPVAYVGSPSPGSAGPVASGNRAEPAAAAPGDSGPEVPGRISPDLSVTPLYPNGRLNLPDAFVRETRVLPPADSAANSGPAPGGPAGNDVANPSGTYATVNAGSNDTRVRRLETQVADLTRQLETLGNRQFPTYLVPRANVGEGNRLRSQVDEPNRELRATRHGGPVPVYANPRPDLAQAARRLNTLGTEVDALQQGRAVNDPAVRGKLDSLLAEVSALGTQLDSVPTGAPAGPLAAGLAGNGNRISPDGASPEDERLEAMQDELTALRGEVDRMQRQLAAAEVAPALPRRLPHGSLVIYYPLNSARINDADRQRLEVLARQLLTNKTGLVQVKGFTDQTGSAAYNLSLSRKRAEGICAYLVEALAVEPERIIVNYFGQAQAAQAKENPYDRRVELEIYAVDQ